ncbi:flagellar motor switch protein FliN [uncultured Pseudokineococcus sp.]|uniref:flagellar motor switch protein FliN n=1 Tax=uncultured Pseudokineococcus sp. TaxID=1642928 RepID=UPI00262F6427|nr:flagellar motor switch protein FliN [uncultured Pseudokineococcus sp.]
MSAPTTTAPFGVAEVAAAARAAAGLVPAPGALVVDPAADGAPATWPEPSAPAVVATFSGARSGLVVLVLDAATSGALAADPAGPGADGLAEALRPALEAAAGSLGPVALGPLRTATAGELDLASAPVVPLLTDGTARAWASLVATGEQLPAVTPGAPVGASSGLHLLRDVEMVLSVEIGRARMTVAELLTLAPGRVVELDRAAGAPADLLVNGRVVARGEVVVVDEDFGLRVTEILGSEQS